MPPVDADHAKSGAFVQDQTRPVLGKDPRDQLPEAASFILADQGVERRPPCPHPARLPGRVNRVLGDPRIRRPRPVRARPGKGEDLAIALDDDGRVSIALLAELRLQMLDGARLSLERGDALLNALVIDAGDGSRVLGARDPR